MRTYVRLPVYSGTDVFFQAGSFLIYYQLPIIGTFFEWPKDFSMIHKCCFPGVFSEPHTIKILKHYDQLKEFKNILKLSFGQKMPPRGTGNRVIIATNTAAT